MPVARHQSACPFTWFRLFRWPRLIYGHAPGCPGNSCSFKRSLTLQDVRRAGLPFTSSIISSRKTRWVDSNFKRGRSRNGDGPLLFKYCVVTHDRHTIPPSLLANAQATTQECRRASIARVQSATEPPFFIQPKHECSGTPDQQVANIFVASLGNPKQSRSTAGAVLPWYRPNRGGEVRLHRYCFPESGIPSAIAQRQAIRLYFDHRQNPLRLRRILAVRQRLNIGMTVGMARYQVGVRPPVRHHGSYFDWRTARANGPER